jgi:hypothetical protein
MWDVGFGIYIAVTEVSFLYHVTLFSLLDT